MTIEEQKDIEQLIGASSRILITTRGNPGFDDLAAALAWFHWLSGMKKERLDIAIDLPDRIKNRFKFLPGFDRISSNIRASDNFVIHIDTTRVKPKELSYDMRNGTLEVRIKPEGGQFSAEDVSFSESEFSYNVIIVLGAPELAAVGSIFERNRDLFFKTPIINIDRSSANARFGQVNAVYLTATSLAEISYPFMKQEMTKDIANALLTGLIAATNSFQTPQVTPDTLQLAGELIVAGASRADIIDRLYRTKDLVKLKLWGRVLSHLQQADGAIIYSHLLKEEVGSGEIDLHGLVDELVMASPEAQIVLFFYQEKDTETRVFAYARDNYDLPLMFQKYKAEGRRRQVNFTLPKDTVQTELEVLNHVKEQLRLMNH